MTLLRIQNELNSMQCKMLKHPAYSLGLLPCNFHVSGPVKEISGIFTSDNDMQYAVVHWKQQPKEFFAHGIH